MLLVRLIYSAYESEKKKKKIPLVEKEKLISSCPVCRMPSQF